MADAAKLGLEISGIHGRTGGIHDAYSLFGRMIMTVLNKGMVDTCELITTLGRQVPKNFGPRAGDQEKGCETFVG